MNPSTALARVVIDELIRLGVRDVVLAPGSRSAALALAVAAADRADLLRLHVRVDERSAGFLALGLAKVSRIPVAVIVTSGTAVSNLLPAVTEASYAGVPILLLTADRPAELRGTGANQTIDQSRTFGTLVRQQIELGPAEPRLGAVRSWRGIVDAAVSATTDSLRPGPAHLNIAFRDPLVPHLPDALVLGEWPEPLGLIDLEPPTDIDLDEQAAQLVVPAVNDRRAALMLQEPIDEVLSAIAEIDTMPARGIVIVGDIVDPTDAEDAALLAESSGWPILSEPSGNAKRGPHAIAHAPLLLADPNFSALHRPEVVVTVGRVGLSRSIIGLLRDARVHVACDPGRTGLDWPDPARTARAVLSAVPLPADEGDDEDEADTATAIENHGQQTTPDWLDDWLLADAAAAAVVDRVLAESEGLTGPWIARKLCAAAVDESLLLVAASRPVRDVEAFAAVREDGPLIIGNRGTSGIDGLVSTAWGAAIAHQDAGGSTAYALLGDLAFIHDSNGLVVGSDEPAPDLVIVVVDNDGGGIFSGLEQGDERYTEDFERVFGTPHGTDLAEMASSMGVPGVYEVNTPEEFDEALATATHEGSVHVIVAHTVSRADEMLVRQHLREAIATRT